MAFDRLLGQAECRRDLGVRGARAHEVDDLDLAIRRPAVRRPRSLERGCREHRAATRDDADGVEDGRHLRTLVQVAGRATLDGSSDDRWVAESREHQDRRRRGGALDRIEDVEPFGVPIELDVADEDVDAIGEDHRVGQGRARTDVLEIRALGDGARDRRDDRWVVVDDPDADPPDRRAGAMIWTQGDLHRRGEPTAPRWRENARAASGEIPQCVVISMHTFAVTGDLGSDGDPRLTATELAALAGTTVERVAILTEYGVLRATGPDAFTRGDVHRVRLLAAFEAAGVPFEALVAASATGQIDFEGYHELHRDPGLPSARPYAAFRAAVDPRGDDLAALFAATGLAEAHPASRLTVDEEALLKGWLGLLAALDDRSLAVRVVRLYAEAARRTAAAAMDVYMEAASRLGPDPAAVDMEDYARLLEPWAQVARAIPSLAEWLTERHLRAAIDAFSVETTERLLEAGGFVPARVVDPPAIAFVDLTGFTRTTQELGDEAAAGLSLRLGDLARTHVEAHGGRLVKLLGDGALLYLPDAAAAVKTTVALLAALPAAGLPSGHAGVHHGPVIEREGDVFGRTVNLAARIADRAPDGAVYVTTDVVTALEASRFAFESAGVADLQGIGPVELYRVRT